MSEEFDSELDRKVAAVTGTSSGIGSVAAKSLASRGVSVIAAARREGELEELVATIGDDDGDVLIVLTDVTADDDIDTPVEMMFDGHDRIDIPISNAGLMPLAHIGEADREMLQTTIDVNLIGLITLTHAVVPTMMEQEGGHIVNLSSVVDRFLQTNSSRYNVAKVGVKIFSDSPRLDVVEAGIRVSSIEPDAVDAELLDHIPDEKVRRNVKDYVGTMGALASEDIMRAIVLVVTQLECVDTNEVLICPLGQAQP